MKSSILRFGALRGITSRLHVRVQKITAIILVASFFLAPLQPVFAGARFYPDSITGPLETNNNSAPSLTSLMRQAQGFDSVEQPKLVESKSVSSGGKSGGEAVTSFSTNRWLNSYADSLRLPSVSPNSGAFAYDVPIVTPPGRNGIEPNLRLSYSNQSKDSENIFGFGWSINIPYIERVNKNGLNTMYSQVNFTSSLDGELATTTTANVYGAKFDDGSFREYTLPNATSTWTVLDKSGTEYLFGTSSTAQLVNSDDSDQVFRWYLQRVKDMNGNIMLFGYTKDNGQVYPSWIRYTSTASSSAPFEVNFTTEARPEDIESYQHGFLVKTLYRISDISVKFNGSEVHNYDLGYTAGHNGVRSLLSSITESGVGDIGTTQLPAMTFSYQTIAITWASSTPPNNPPSLVDVNGRDTGFRVFNYSTSSASSLFRFATTSPNKRYQGIAWTQHDLPNNYPVWIDESDQERGGAATDVNGDGYLDIILSRGNSVNPPEYQEVYLWDSSANEFDLATSSALSNIPLMIDNYLDDMGIRFGDFNGDGYADYLQGREQNYDYKLFLNKADGSGWENGVAINNASTTYFVDPDGNDLGTRVADVNGDGLDDLIRKREDDTYAEINLNKGNGLDWDRRLVQTGVPSLVDPVGKDIGVRLMDIDGDGLADLLLSAVGRGIQFYINKGNGVDFGSQPTTTVPYLLNELGKDIGVRIIDGNDDGIPDFVEARSGTYRNHLSDGKPVDVMTGIRYPAGGNTAIAYQGTRVGVVLIQTVDTITHGAGFNQASTTLSYDFSDGVFQTDFRNRKFTGFGKVIITDSEGHGTETYFQQGNGTGHTGWPLGEADDIEAKMYKPWYIKQFGVGTTTQSITFNTWDDKDLGAGRKLVYPQKTLTLNYDGGSTHRDSATVFDYATSTGNLISKTELGEVVANETGGVPDGTYTDTGSDTRTTEYSYATDGDNIIGLLSQETLKDNSSSRISETKIYYDSQSHGTITLGNPTKQEFWKTGSDYASTTKVYNSFGLPTEERDALGNLTTHVYDPYNLYVATTTNPIGYTTQYQYNYAFGKVKETTDPNSRVFQTTFDGLGRVLTEKQPDLTTSATLVTKTSYTYTDTSSAVKIQRTDNLDGFISVDSYEYYDGLKRLIQKRVESESGTYAVKDQLYDNRGKLYQESLPYFSSGSGYTNPTASTTLYTVYLYDAIGRLATTSNAVGTTTNSYFRWETLVTDPNTNSKKFVNDAFGRLTTVVEYASGVYGTTTYTWFANNTLATTTDAESNIRGFTYDGMGKRLIAQDLHDVSDTTYGAWAYTYDNAGNVISIVDPKNQTTNFTYDGLNRVLTEDYTGQTGTEVLYGYDTCAEGKLRLCSATTTAVVSKYLYNPLGGAATTTQVIGGIEYVTAYIYDRLGNTTKITYPDNSEVRYTYNAAGLLETLEQKEGNGSFAYLIDDFDYGPTGHATFISFGNDDETTYTYDASKLYRLTNILTTATSSSQQLMMSGGGESSFTLASIDGKTASERADLKGQAIANLGSIPKTKRTSKDFMGSIEIVYLKPISGGVSVYARAWDSNDEPIGFGKDGSVEIERFNIYNPPVLVDDSGGKIIRAWTDSSGESLQRTLREDPKEALLQTLEHIISVKQEKFGSENIVSGKLGNTTSTFYPNADPGSTSVDGVLLRHTVDETFSTIHTATGNDSNSTSAEDHSVLLQVSATSNQYQALIRSMFLFDTAALPDGDTISNATLSIYGGTGGGGTSCGLGGTNYEIVSSNPSSNTSLGTSDYEYGKYGTTAFGAIACSSWSTSGYNNFTLNASGQANVTKTGVSKFGARSTYDLNNTAPTWVSGEVIRMRAYYADEAGTTKDPKLVVEHSTSAVIQDLSFTSYDNVGNILTLVDDSDSSVTETFTYQYDELYRLFRTSVATSSGESLMGGGGGESLLMAAAPVPTPALSSTSTLFKLLKDKTAEERATIKGEEIAKIGAIEKIKRVSQYWNGYIEVVGTTAIKDGVSVFAKAWDDLGRPIGFGIDGSVEIERFNIYNPPVLLDDEKGDIVREWEQKNEITGEMEKKTRTLKLDIQEALLQSLEHIISVKKEKFGDGNVIKGKIGNTTSTFYPDAHTESTSVDGNVNKGGSDTWSTVHDATDGDSANDSSTYMELMTSHYPSPNFWQIRRAFVLFNTSAIPSADTISSATLSLYGNSTNDTINDSNSYIAVMQATPSVNTAIGTADFDQVGTTEGSSQFDISNFSVSAYNNLTLNATGLSWIGKGTSGMTKLAVREGHDINNSPWTPGGGYQFEEAQPKSADQAGTTYDPKLVVEHSRVPVISLAYPHILVYTPIGNIASTSFSGEYTYGETNYANPSAVTEIGTGLATTTYSYDNNGNLTGDGTWTYNWDYKNRLATSTATSTTSYAYDHTGQRVRKTTGSVNTFYPNKYYNVSNATTTKHIFTPSGQLIATIEGNGTATTTNYIHPDHLGGTHVVTNTSGQVVQTINYYPFGKVRNNTQSTSFNEQRKYIGQHYDEESELSYLNARYYDPDRGQFISQDPVFWGNSQNLYDPQSLNSYSYANNNPINKEDPNGRSAKETLTNILNSLVSALKSLLSILSGGGGSGTSPKSTPPTPQGGGGGDRTGSYQSYNQSYAATQQDLYNNKVKYVPGGNGPDEKCGGGVDCSGAIIYGIRKAANPNFPDITAQQLHDEFSVPGDGSAGTVNYYSDKSGGGVVHATTNLGNGTVINPYDEAHGITNPSATAVEKSFRHAGGDVFPNMQLNWALIMKTNQ